MPTNKNSGKLLIFDFDNTIVKGHLHSKLSRLGKADYNTQDQNSVKKEYLDSFVTNENTGVQNEKKLTSVLQSAFDKGVDVAIASFTKFPKAVEYVKDNHLGLTKEQAQQIKVIGDFPIKYKEMEGVDQDKASAQSQLVGKNLHVVECLKQYYKKHGSLPQNVELVDDSRENIEHFNKFYEEISKDPEWFKDYTEVDVKKLQNIKFKGVQVPKGASVDNKYLDEVTNFVNNIDIQLKEPLDSAANSVGKENAGIVKQYLMEDIAKSNSGLSVEYNKGKSSVTVTPKGEATFPENFEQNCKEFATKIADTLQRLADEGKINKSSNKEEIDILLRKELTRKLSEQKVQQKKGLFRKIADFFFDIMAIFAGAFFGTIVRDKLVDLYYGNQFTKVDSKNDKAQGKNQSVSKKESNNEKTTLSKKDGQKETNLKSDFAKNFSDFIYEQKINLANCIKEVNGAKKLDEKAVIVNELVTEAIEKSCKNAKVKVDKNLITVFSNRKSDTPSDLQEQCTKLGNKIDSTLQDLASQGKVHDGMNPQDIKRLVKAELGELKLPGAQQSEIKSSQFEKLAKPLEVVKLNSGFSGRLSKKSLSLEVNYQNGKDINQPNERQGNGRNR